jgi:hypothetical protein
VKVQTPTFYLVENVECVRALPLSGAILPLKKICRPLLTGGLLPGPNTRSGLFRPRHTQMAFAECRLVFFIANNEFYSFFVQFSRKPTDYRSRGTFSLFREYFEKLGVGSEVFGKNDDFYLPKMGSQFQVKISAEKLGS